MKRLMLNVVVSLGLVFTSMSMAADLSAEAGAKLDKMISDSVTELSRIAKYNTKHSETIKLLEWIVPAIVAPYQTSNADEQEKVVLQRNNAFARLQELSKDQKIHTLADFEEVLKEILNRKTVGGVPDVTVNEERYLNTLIGLVEQIKSAKPTDPIAKLMMDGPSKFPTIVKNPTTKAWEHTPAIPNLEIEEAMEEAKLAKASWQSCPTPKELARRLEVIKTKRDAEQAKLDAVKAQIVAADELQAKPDAMKPNFMSRVRGKVNKEIGFSFYANKGVEKVTIDGKELTLKELDQLAAETLVKDFGSAEYSEAVHPKFSEIAKLNVGDVEKAEEGKKQTTVEATEAFDSMPLMADLQKKLAGLGSFQFEKFSSKGAEAWKTDLQKFSAEVAAEHKELVKKLQGESNKHSARIEDLNGQSATLNTCATDRTQLDAHVHSLGKAQKSQLIDVKDHYKDITERAKVKDAP